MIRPILQIVFELGQTESTHDAQFIGFTIETRNSTPGSLAEVLASHINSAASQPRR